MITTPSYYAAARDDKGAIRLLLVERKPSEWTNPLTGRTTRQSFTQTWQGETFKNEAAAMRRIGELNGVAK